MAAGHHNYCGCPVVYASGVASSHATILAKDGLEGCELFQRGVSARVLIVGDDQRFALLLRNGNSNDLLRELARLLGCNGSLMATQGIGILIGATDLVTGGDILSSFP